MCVCWGGGCVCWNTTIQHFKIIFQQQIANQLSIDIDIKITVLVLNGHLCLVVQQNFFQQTLIYICFAKSIFLLLLNCSGGTLIPYFIIVENIDYVD